MKNILALDVATNCGWAHSSGPSGTWDLSVKRDESSGMRLIRLVAKLNEMKAAAGVDLLFFEAAQVYIGHMSGVLVEAEMLGTVKLWCEQNNVEYASRNIAQIKKHATGKGNAKKDMMLASARARWSDRQIKTADEADALWLLDLVLTDLAIAKP